MPESTQNLPLTSGAITTDATSLSCLLETLERQRTLLEKILGALLEKQDVRPGPAQGIFADYLRPEELAAEFRIRETQLFEWKRKGFGPPRTRIRQLVVYRRKGGSAGGGRTNVAAPTLWQEFFLFDAQRWRSGFLLPGRTRYLHTLGGHRTESSWRRRRRRGPTAPGRNYDISCPTAGPARRVSAPRPEPALCTITHPRQRGLIDAITWE